MGGNKPSVTLTFAGDSAKLEQSMGRVGSSSEKLGREVGSASEKMRGAGVSAESLAEKSDTAEARSQGFADVITGATEGLAAWNDESLSTQEKMVALGQAGADLAGGLTNFLIPAVASLATGMKTGLGSALSFIAAHPLVFALLAIAAVLVLLWMRSETFREVVTKAFDAVAGAVTRTLGGAWDWLVGKFDAFIGAYERGRDRLLGLFRGVGDGIKDAFRGAFNFASNAWNNTIGRLSWTVPGWVPGLGGSSISAPRLPTFHAGGTVPGLPGQEMLALLEGGEEVTPRSQAGGRRLVLTFAGDADSAIAEAIKHLFRTGHITLQDLA